MIKRINPPQPMMNRKKAAGKKLATRGDRLDFMIQIILSQALIIKTGEWNIHSPVVEHYVSLNSPSRISPSSSGLLGLRPFPPLEGPAELPFPGCPDP